MRLAPSRRVKKLWHGRFESPAAMIFVLALAVDVAGALAPAVPATARTPGSEHSGSIAAATRAPDSDESAPRRADTGAEQMDESEDGSGGDEERDAVEATGRALHTWLPLRAASVVDTLHVHAAPRDAHPSPLERPPRCG